MTSTELVRAEGQLPTGEPINWVNASGVEINFQDDPKMREVAAQLATWVTDNRKTNNASLFNKQAYVAPDNPFMQIQIARRAVNNDDIIGGLADTTEGLIFQGVQWESSVADEADIFNQLAARINLDGLLREAYRTLFTDSQVVFASWWDYQSFKLRGRKTQKDVDENGVATIRRGPVRRKTFDVYSPTRITILDSLKVIPIGNRLWGQDRLAWHTTKEELAYFQALQAEAAFGLTEDPTMLRLFKARYIPDKVEAAELGALGVNPDYLLEFNPEYVWRHTLTKPSHARFADVRLASTFKLLDLKQQLMEADRVNLVGAANYILLVKKGSPEAPAHSSELENLKDNFDVIARLPVIISDHRLNIEIITPKQDLVLQGDKYDTLNRRLLDRVIGTLSVGGQNKRAADDTTNTRAVARLLENRRHMLKRTLEEHIARAVVDHPRNANVNGQGFEHEPNLAFTPRNVQLDSDAPIVQAVQAARASKEISRKSYLEYFGFDQEVEAQRREVEAEQYDPIFGTVVPFSSPNPDGVPNNNGGTPPPQVTGAQGGRPSGGGKPSQNVANPQPRNRTPRQVAAAEGATEEAER